MSRLVLRSSAVAAGLTGLDWDGTAPGKRMLYWHDPPSIYNTTVLCKVFMRTNQNIVRADGSRYGTIFFWGNDGDGTYDNGGFSNNWYYGIEPYPRKDQTNYPNPVNENIAYGPWQFEVATYNKDYVTGVDIVNNAWYSLAHVATRVGGEGTQTHHKGWMALPSTSAGDIVESVDGEQTGTWATAAHAPPTPAMFFGQSPEWPGHPGFSWGHYLGYDELNGIIRAIQIYTTALTQAQVVARAALDTDAAVLSLNTSDGISSAWYLNMNPTPTDVTDKSGNGHDGSWNHASNRPGLWSG